MAQVLISVQEAAHRLNLPIIRAYRLVDTGKLAGGYAPNGQTLWVQADSVAKYAKKHPGQVSA